MKRLIFSLIIVLFPLVVFGQMVVSDPTATAVNKAGWAKSLAEAAKQCKELEETKRLMSESIEMYSKVSTTIRNAQMVKNIFDRQVKMVSDISRELKRKDGASLKMFANYCSRLNSIIAENNAYIELLKTTLSSYEKMTSGERLRLIMDLDTETKKLYRAFYQEKRTYDNYNKSYRILSNMAK